MSRHERPEWFRLRSPWKDFLVGFTFAAILMSLALCTKAARGEEVTASFYSRPNAKACDGSARSFDAKDAAIAAHRTLPCGTKLEVSAGAKTLLAKVTHKSRGHRDLNLSPAAAAALGLRGRATGAVRYRVLEENAPVSPAEAPAPEPEPATEPKLKPYRIGPPTFEERYRGCPNAKC